MTLGPSDRLAIVALLGVACTVLGIGGEGLSRLALSTAAAQEPAPSQVLASPQPADPAAPGSLQPPLSPAPRPRRVTTVSLEVGGAQACGTTLDGLGAVVTVPVGGPFVVGAELFRGESSDLLSDAPARRGGLYGVLGGVEATGARARAALLLRLGAGTGTPDSARLADSVTLPQVALRGEASLLVADHFLLGLWGTAGGELGTRTRANPGGPAYRVGGRVLGAGVSLGLAFGRGGRAASAPSDPAEPP